MTFTHSISLDQSIGMLDILEQVLQNVGLPIEGITCENHSLFVQCREQLTVGQLAELEELVGTFDDALYANAAASSTSLYLVSGTRAVVRNTGYTSVRQWPYAGHMKKVLQFVRVNAYANKAATYSLRLFDVDNNRILSTVACSNDVEQGIDMIPSASNLSIMPTTLELQARCHETDMETCIVSIFESKDG